MLFDTICIKCDMLESMKSFKMKNKPTSNLAVLRMIPSSTEKTVTLVCMIGNRSCAQKITYRVCVPGFFSYFSTSGPTL